MNSPAMPFSTDNTRPGRDSMPSKWNLAGEEATAFNALLHTFNFASPVEVPPCLTRQRYIDVVENSKGD